MPTCVVIPMTRHLLVSLLVTACASAPASRPSPAPAPPPVQPLIQIRAGGWPGSNTHRWGIRLFEVRGEPGRRELRIHDAIDFQGVGMQPADMPPTRHACTAWEPLPASIDVPAGMKSCGDSTATCDAIWAWLRSTAPPPPPAPGPGTVHVGADPSFGRGPAA